MTIQFDFTPAHRILFGAGKVSTVGEIAKAFGRRAFVVRGGGRAQPERITDALRQSGIEWIEVEIQGEPSIDSVRQTADRARETKCDLVIAYGGGSVLDTGKAVSALLTNTGDLLDYVEVVGKSLPLTNLAAPMIAVPTTAGTGSEVTRNAVMSVPEHRVKVSLRSPLMLPRVALVDPELTHSVPPNITATTGMDALTQGLEPYVSNRANPMTDLFCREGLARAGRSLLRAYEAGNDRPAREDMAWASLLGGLALANAGLGAVHGFAAPIGGMFAAPHGAVCACLLPHVVRVNLRAFAQRDPQHSALERYDEIGRLLTGDSTADRATAADWLDSAVSALEIPPLRTYGVQPTDFPAVIEGAVRSSSMKGNPIALREEELTEILLMAW